MSAQPRARPFASLQHRRRRRGAAALVVLGTLVGWAVALGGQSTDLATAAVVIFTAAATLALAERRRGGVFVIELPIMLLLVDVYFSRPRTASALTQNPVDSTGAVKLAAIVLAALIGAFAYLTSRAGGRVIQASFRLYALYAVAIFLGMRSSVDPPLTAFHGLELAAGVLAIAGAYRRYGQEALERMERLLYGATVALVLSVWLSVAVSPGAARVPVSGSPLPWQIAGVYPPIASNGVGTLGVVLTLWSLGRLADAEKRGPVRRRWATAFAVLGIATLVAAQYRTGYVELTVGLAFLLLLRGRKTLALLGALVTVVAVIWGLSGTATTAQPFLLRGDTTQRAEQLSGRLNMWQHAIPFWRESPIFGRGLLTSTRLEVLPSIGYADTGTIHGTWIEALVGTGLVGTALLAASVLVLFGRTLATGLRPDGRVVPTVLVVSLLVRSATGGSFESLGVGAMMVMIFALDRSRQRSLERPSVPAAARPQRASARPVLSRTGR